MPKLTDIVKREVDKIKEILYSDKVTIVGKTIALKELGRKIAEELYTAQYNSLDEFYADYDRGADPMQALEGRGTRKGDLVILDDCPVAGLHDSAIDLFKEGGAFPPEWDAIVEEYKQVFKNEAILHPLCIVHQRIREELAKKIPKGTSYVHATEVACRSMKTGKIVMSDWGMQLSGEAKEEIEKLIDKKACIYYIA
ncbi:MAG: hypothetical protein HZA22_08225 [Nitrospirae bacterium]|nr:hypothetical protein [Nitrospirota bacterium]MBI5696669.1 hypothetical protein [Nitrospirota bacterium]